MYQTQTVLFSIIIMMLTKINHYSMESTYNDGADNNLELLILHTNDMHARFDETSKLSGTCYKRPCYGGFARVSTIFKEARLNATKGLGPENVLILNAGDTYTGTTYFTVYRSNITVEFVNYLNFDALSLGNHEFDLGVEGLLPFIEGVKSPIVCTNINATEEPELAKSKLKRSTIIDVNGTKIGIIGYLTNETKYISKAERTEFLNEIDTIKLESERLDKEGVKILIALGHSGFDVDREIARNIPLIDLVIGGHSNTFLYTGTQPDSEVPEGLYPTMIAQPSGKQVPVVQAYAYTKYVGKLFLTVNSVGDVIKATGNPILVTDDIEKDPLITEALQKYQKGVEELKRQVVGQTKVLLYSDTCRIEECNIGNFITDALVHHHRMEYYDSFWTDAPISIINGGGIRSSLDGRHTNGNITVSDLMTTLPFGNMIQTVTITGDVLLEVFEHSARQHKLGGFLQVSGIHVVYDLANPETKVKSLKVRCGSCAVPTYENVDLNKTYRVVVMSFSTAGGDGFTMLMNKNYTNEGVDDIAVVTRYFEKFSPITTGLEERIVFYRDVEASTPEETEDFLIVICCLVVIIALLIGIAYFMYKRQTRQSFGLR